MEILYNCSLPSGVSSLEKLCQIFTAASCCCCLFVGFSVFSFENVIYWAEIRRRKNIQDFWLSKGLVLFSVCLEFIFLLLSAMTSSINTSELLPLAAAQAHTMALLLPCLTHEGVCVRSWASWKLVLIIIPNSYEPLKTVALLKVTVIVKWFNSKLKVYAWITSWQLWWSKRSAQILVDLTKTFKGAWLKEIVQTKNSRELAVFNIRLNGWT